RHGCAGDTPAPPAASRTSAYRARLSGSPADTSHRQVEPQEVLHTRQLEHPAADAAHAGDLHPLAAVVRECGGPQERAHRRRVDVRHLAEINAEPLVCVPQRPQQLLLELLRHRQVELALEMQDGIATLVLMQCVAHDAITLARYRRGRGTLCSP